MVLEGSRVGLPFPSRPKVSSSEKVARLNTHFPDFYPLCYSLDKVAEIHLAALFRLLPLAFLVPTLFCLPFFSDPREKAWKDEVILLSDVSANRTLGCQWGDSWTCIYSRSCRSVFRNY